MDKKVSEKVAKLLLEIGAITLRPKKPFRYSSGILSPIYTDCRTLISLPKERKIIRDYYIENIKKAGDFDVIAGTATAGIPHAAWIAEKINLPMIYVRGKAKDHGKGNQIEGVIKKNQKAAVIEDLISTGSSSLEAIDAINKQGGKASHVFSIITYGMASAQKNFKLHKTKLISLTDFNTVIEVAAKYKFIKNEEQKIVLDWIKDPPSWGTRMGFE
ncbi:orotate phosphoribosyltransferase [Patescibacteria group bacterium]|nr:orotate phosphoribosyltransferase [Patescibacteria group bacterium]